MNRWVDRTKRYGIAVAVCVAVLCWSGPAHTQQTAGSPYELSLRRDTLLFAAGGLAQLAGHRAVSTMTVPDVRTLDRGDVFGPDRFATDYYSKKISSWSDATRDITKGLFIASLVPHLTGDGGPEYHSLITDAAMYVEATMLLVGLTETAKGLAERPRPYVYNDDVPTGTRQMEGSFTSFWSGHTSYTFMSAVFTGCVVQNRYPASKWVTPVWVSGLTLAASTGAFRVRSGNHYPTDILMSAAVGSFIGWLVPRLHRTGERPVTVGPYASGGGMNIALRF